MVIRRIANGVTLAEQSFFWWSLSATNLIRYMDASEDVSRTALMQVPGDRAAFWYSLAPFSMAEVGERKERWLHGCVRLFSPTAVAVLHLLAHKYGPNASHLARPVLG